MRTLDRKLFEYTDFLTKASHNEAKLGNQLYVMTGIIQTYYEFISCILDNKTTTSNTQAKQLEKLKNNTTITEQQYNIMDETRKLRNKLLHDLLYEPTAQEIIDFHDKCLNSSPKLLAPEQVEGQFLNSVLTGYCFIDAQLRSTIEKKFDELQGEEV